MRRTSCFLHWVFFRQAISLPFRYYLHVIAVRSALASAVSARREQLVTTGKRSAEALDGLEIDELDELAFAPMERPGSSARHYEKLEGDSEAGERGTVLAAWNDYPDSETAGRISATMEEAQGCFPPDSAIISQQAGGQTEERAGNEESNGCYCAAIHPMPSGSEALSAHQVWAGESV